MRLIYNFEIVARNNLGTIKGCYFRKIYKFLEVTLSMCDRRDLNPGFCLSLTFECFQKSWRGKVLPG